MGPQNTEFKNNFAEWQSSSAFNTYWQYSFVNRSLFYASVKSEYREYMVRWVQNYLWWYDGYVPYFHNSDQGIFSTKIGTAIVNGAARKVVGGRIYFKNANSEKPVKDVETGKYIINKALSYVSSEWADKVNFSREIKKAVTFAAAAGTALLKLDKHGEKLTPKALRFDSFYPTIGFNGQIIDLVCFLKDFTRISDVKNNASKFESIYVVEHRYFTDYTEADGRVTHNKPVVSYEIKRANGTITSGQDYSTTGQSVNWEELSRTMRRELAKAFNGISFNKPIPLPFVNHLGAEIVNWTDCVSALPELPFGDSLLFNIMPYLQSYDYYWSAFNTDMYLGRGRVLMPKYMGSSGNNKAQNSGLDSMLYVKVETVNPEDQKPTPIQFDLRADDWQKIRDTIIQNIAINTGMNVATIASFLNDTTGNRTAREISTEESETALFVEDKREIIEKPINRLLKLVTLHQGFTDDVVIRWSETGLTNIYARTDMLATAVSSGFVSKQTAMQMFRQDDDEYQQQEEWERIKEDQESNSMNYGGMFNDGDFYGNT